MNIKEAQYYKTPYGTDKTYLKATIDGEKLFIPQDPLNRHFAEIQKQVAEKKLIIKEAD